MKTRRKLNSFTVSAILSLCLTESLSAAVITGQLTAGRRATDVWKFTCDVDSHQLQLFVADDGPGERPRLSAQLFRAGKASNTTDRVSLDGDDQSHGSPAIRLRGGPGEYYVLIDKAGAGEKNYSAFVDCLSKDGFHTSIISDPDNPIQDQ